MLSEHLAEVNRPSQAADSSSNTETLNTSDSEMSEVESDASTDTLRPKQHLRRLTALQKSFSKHEAALLTGLENSGDAYM